jgi:sugar lactone lactonase YvrE
MRLTPIPVLLALAALLPAADLPLGTVDKAADGTAEVRFDAAARLAPGQVVALFAPGTVVRHPLTKKVVTEERRLAAKGQVVAVGEGGRIRLRIFWTAAGAAVEAGWDAVPQPGESAPNGPPALTAEVKPVAAQPGQSLRVALPVVDPDGDPLAVSWSIEGPAGRSGRLDSRITALPETVWTAPASAPNGTIGLKAVVRDSLGQELAVSVPLTVAGADDPQKRAFKAFARHGAEVEPAVARIERAADGGWLGVAADGRKLWRWNAGWGLPAEIQPAKEAEFRRLAAVVPLKGEILALDAGAKRVVALAADGALRRSYEGLAEPTDLAVLGGVVAVADPGAGCVQLYEASGRYRGHLGRTGKAEDDWRRPERLAIDRDDNLFILDIEARQVQRFDRGLRRLDPWQVPGDARIPPVDIAAAARGLVVLMADGGLALFDGKGAVVAQWRSAQAAGVIEEAGAPVSLSADTSGELMVCYPGSQAVVRHGADGTVLGVRGVRLRGGIEAATAADGQGRWFGFDGDAGQLAMFDGEGWRTARLGGWVSAGGPFGKPIALAAVPDGSAVLALDSKRYAVVRLVPGGRDAPAAFGAEGEGPGQFDSPVAIAADEAGRAYVLDEDLYRVSVFDAKGAFLFAFGQKGKGDGELYEPKLVAVSPAGDAAFVYDSYRYEIKRFTLDQDARAGRHTGNLGGKGDERGQFREPIALGVDRQGLLHVVDGGRGDLQAIDVRGAAMVALGVRKLDDLGLPKLQAAAVTADGQVWLSGRGQALGLRW